MKKMLIIGGTGIIGKATTQEALGEGYDVTTISLEKDNSISNKVHQVLVDKQNPELFSATASKLNQTNEWDVVFDVYNLGKSEAEQTCINFRNRAKHIIVISTTLVYDRSQPNEGPIPSSHPLAKPGTMGGYADHKLELENYWQSVKDVPWTLLRPYHVVGPHCLLGCLPDENRDPKLLKKIVNEEELPLCEEGEVQFNYIHPKDIARVALHAANNPKAFGKAYNTLNPTPIRARDYYDIIGEILGKKAHISNKPIEQVWSEGRGWELTTLPHLYDMSDLEKDLSFMPSIPLETALEESVRNYPTGQQQIKEIAVHKRMTLEPRPQRIGWLLSDKRSTT